MGQQSEIMYNSASMPVGTRTVNVYRWSGGSGAPTYPLTAGANWAEWVTPGAEWRIGPSSSSGAAAYVALFVTASVTGSNIDLTAEVVFSE